MAYSFTHNDVILLFFQAAFLAALLFFLLFLTVIIRTMEVRIERWWTPERAIFKHPKVICSPFGCRFPLIKNTHIKYEKKTDPKGFSLFIFLVTCNIVKSFHL